MQKIRLLNQPEDYKKLGVNQGPVEIWEDGRRDDDRSGAMEWWYFDAVLDDGTKVVVHFHTKQPATAKSKTPRPQSGLVITLPDGTVYSDEPFCKPEEMRCAKEKCDVRFAENWVTGDLKHYDIHFENKNGIGADLKIDSLSSPWRPGSAYYDFGDGKYYTWLCAVPKGRLSGTLTYEGKTRQVSGYAYHDHQWLTITSMEDLNNWVWARQALGDDYSILNFDIVASKGYDFQRLPIFVVEDKDGNVIFECTDPEKMECEVLDEYRGHQGKDYPKVTHYKYYADGMTADYTLTANHQNYVMDVLSELPKQTEAKLGKIPGKIATPFITGMMKKNFEKKEIRPSYANYSATGHLVLTDENGKTIVDASSELIYEFVFMGLKCREYMETK